MQQDFAGMHGRKPLACDDVAPLHVVQFFALNTHFILLVVINDFHICGVTVFPTETDTPLVVDTDAPLPCSIASQQFEAVAGRHSQLIEFARGIDELEFSPCYSLNLMRKLANKPPVKHRSRSLIGK
jgi:hypothetical protein